MNLFATFVEKKGQSFKVIGRMKSEFGLLVGTNSASLLTTPKARACKIDHSKVAQQRTSDFEF